MINLSKEVLNLRFNNIEIYRRKLISEVRQKRMRIINEMEKNKEKSKYKSNNEIMDEDEALEKEINEMIDKGEKTLEKIRQKQKCIIEAQIEKKIKNVIIKLKSDKKEKKIKELNDKKKEDRKMKALLEEQKLKEKERIRKQAVENNLKERVKRNEEKQKAEEKRMKKKKQNKKKEKEKKNKEYEDKYIRREKELEELIKKEKEERFLSCEQREKINKEKLTRNKLKKEKSIETLKKLLDIKDENTHKRLEGLMTKRHQEMEEQKLKYEIKLKSIEDVMRKTNYNIKKRNDKILEHQLHIDFNVAKMERQKNEKILERVKSQNFLFLRSLKNRESNYKKLQEKFNELHKRLEDKDKKIYEGKINKLKNKTIKQEDEFIKQYEKQHNIIRLNRITMFKNKKKADKISKKEKKIEKYNIRKQTLIQKNMLLSDSIERQKVKLINDFDNALNKNREINADLVKKLFPEDKKFYNKIKNMTDEVYKKYNSEKSNANYSDSKKENDIFLTQNSKNQNNKESKMEKKDDIK